MINRSTQHVALEPAVKIGIQDVTKGLPAFLTLWVMSATYSIADGMLAGVGLDAAQGDPRAPRRGEL